MSRMFWISMAPKMLAVSLQTTPRCQELNLYP
ncbi:hypothetical protein LCGC14_1247600 [marine sediment metagenome]|uniref:Uncharacterized protein n=1 Tax=marine sediment metagenome TaxID=412755 RepID=A0A0F9L409_9ZZZZ